LIQSTTQRAIYDCHHHTHRGWSQRALLLRKDATVMEYLRSPLSARGEASRRKPKDAARGEASRRTFRKPKVALFSKQVGFLRKAATPPEVKLSEGSRRKPKEAEGSRRKPKEAEGSRASFRKPKEAEGRAFLKTSS